MGARRVVLVCLCCSLLLTIFLFSRLSTTPEAPIASQALPYWHQEPVQRFHEVDEDASIVRVPVGAAPPPVRETTTVQGPLLSEPNEEVDLQALAIVKTKDDEEAKREGYDSFQFNAYLSDKIGEARRIPDTRNAKCPNTFQHNLPKASIIICFFNESPTVLLRMLTSIFTRTPMGLVEEILIVDDSSEMLEAAQATREAIENRKEWAKVRLLTTPHNEGLIRAKIFGAKQAKGEVIIFLDSHCEVNQHWLEPLLERIKGDRKRFVTPIIDIIDSDDMRYIGSPVCYGGFDWGMTFKWDYPHRSLLANETFLISPLRSPTMAGGLFAVDKNTFFEYGAYDEGMEVWGAENVEISFRIWQCGASLEVIPCSRIGHIFRRKRPYGMDRDTMGKNSMRTAAVWLDEYFPKFIEARPHLANTAYGDISSRIALRQKLQCKPFRWFLQNIYPSLLPGNTYTVQELQDATVATDGKYLIRHVNSTLCLWGDATSSHVSAGTKIALRMCTSHRLATWKWSRTLELRNMGSSRMCLDSLSTLSLLKCHNQGHHQEWHFTRDGKLYSSTAQKCLHIPEGSHGPAVLEYCALATQFEILKAAAATV